MKGITFKHLLDLFFPEKCSGCDNTSLPSEKNLCIDCREVLSIHSIGDTINQQFLAQKFYGRIEISEIYSFLIYSKNSLSQKLLHQLKYNGEEHIGEILGAWFGSSLADYRDFSDYDIITYVPLHPKKKQQRGYNQVQKFSESVGEKIDLPIAHDLLRRITHNSSLTQLKRFNRWQQIQSSYQLNWDPKMIQGKSILLCDDVITTGATSEACVSQLLSNGAKKVGLLFLASPNSI